MKLDGPVMQGRPSSIAMFPGDTPMIFIRPKSTRHTAIGTLRRDTIYKLDETDRRVRKVLFEKTGKELLPVYEKMTKKAVDKANSEVKSLIPADQPVRKDLAERDARIAELEARLAAADAEIARRDEALKANNIDLPPVTPADDGAAD